MDVVNKTRKPLTLPLPAGKKLFLAPGKTGQVSPAALEHPLIKKLLEAGDIETTSAGPKSKDGGSGKGGAYPGPRQGGPAAVHRSGDR